MTKRRIMAFVFAFILIFSDINFAPFIAGKAEDVQTQEASSDGNNSVDLSNQFGENAKYLVRVAGVMAAAQSQIVVQLESRLGDEAWTPVEHPQMPGKDYTQTLGLNEAGEAQCVFLLTGFSKSNAYRVRILAGFMQDGRAMQYTASYEERHPQEELLVSQITLDVTITEPSATEAFEAQSTHEPSPEATHTPEAEPTLEPSPE